MFGWGEVRGFPLFKNIEMNTKTILQPVLSLKEKSKIYEFAHKWVLNNKDAFSGKDNSCYFKLSKLIRFSAEQVNVFLPQTIFNEIDFPEFYNQLDSKIINEEKYYNTNFYEVLSAFELACFKTNFDIKQSQI